MKGLFVFTGTTIVGIFVSAFLYQQLTAGNWWVLAVLIPAGLLAAHFIDAPEDRAHNLRAIRRFFGFRD